MAQEVRYEAITQDVLVFLQDVPSLFLMWYVKVMAQLHSLQIKNYPVQAFATADIVPLILITIDNMLMPLKSCIVNTVHDSIVIDVHPDEVDMVLQVVEYK